MATPVLNNGIFLREAKLRIDKHIDDFHIASLMGDVGPTDIGPVDIWAMASRAQSPLYNLAIVNKKNFVEVDDPNGRYTWKLPIEYELPQIVEDVEPGNTQKGIYETTFKIKLNKDDFGPGDIITCDQYNGPELYITDATPVKTSDGVIYTVRLASLSTYSFLDNRFLEPGTVWFRKSSAYGEDATKFSHVTAEGGYRQYYNFISTFSVGKEYHIKEEALNRLRAAGQDTLDVLQFFKIENPKMYDPSIQSFDDLSKKLGGLGGVMKAVKRGDLSMAFVNKIEAQILATLQKEIENELMWGHGGRLTVEGNNDIVRQVGLWKQFDFGYKRVYDKRTFSLALIREVIYNYFNGRVDFKGPNPERKIQIQTGMGGLYLINQAIQQEVSSSGMLLRADQSGVGAVQGDRMGLSYGLFYTSYIIPFFANVEFVHNPALDNWNTNNIINPLIDGYNLSSYSFLIFDITNEVNDNVMFLKWRGAPPTKWIYRNGTCDYKGSNIVQSSGNFSGYKVTIKQYVPTVHVKDPTRIAKIVMRNPITGETL
ncbi:MAG: hypothetical protein KatS3mg002_1601 [Candidatus Woesearchaeota archaeon]|nr:MAG: hypothetical protein KatS3mg002_1601 [Candidatus Woesearchaeota archaeon]